MLRGTLVLSAGEEGDDELEEFGDEGIVLHRKHHVLLRHAQRHPRQQVVACGICWLLCGCCAYHDQIVRTGWEREFNIASCTPVPASRRPHDASR